MDQAGLFFEENVKIHPESFSANADYVEFLMYTNRWEELSKAGRQAYKRFPDETAFLEMASTGDYQLGDYEKVLEVCDEILRVAPADSSKTLRSLSTKGDVYHQLGESKKAYKTYEKALKINPNYVYVLNNYAYYLSEEGKSLDKALDMSKRAITLEPNEANYVDTHAWVLHCLGRDQEAKIYMRQALSLQKRGDATYFAHYGDILWALGEKFMAETYWQKAVEHGYDEAQMQAHITELKLQSNDR
jgi:tetratricopeptide (TPR) repeat protein